MDKWSGEGDAGMEKGDSGGRNSLRIRYTASTSLPWINLSSRRYLHVRPSYFLSLSLPPPFFFRFENETINEWKSILFHLIRAPDKNQVIKKRNFPNSILKETISCIQLHPIRANSFPKAAALSIAVALSRYFVAVKIYFQPLFSARRR